MTPQDPQRIGFTVPSAGQRAYHAAAVDEFLATVTATMHGANTVVADDLRRIEFPSAVPGSRAYSADEVDDHLDRLRAELELRQRGTRPTTTDASRTLTVDEIRQVSFGRARLGTPGYREQEVDGLLDRLIDTVTHGGPTAINAAELRRLRLPRSRFGGYRTHEVDAFLALAVTTLRTGRHLSGEHTP